MKKEARLCATNEPRWDTCGSCSTASGDGKRSGTPSTGRGRRAERVRERRGDDRHTTLATQKNTVPALSNG